MKNCLNSNLTTNFSVFGCACFPLLRPYNKNKLQFRSQECLFLDYSPTYKGYKCLSSEGRIYISKDVVVNESRFPYHALFPSSSSSHSLHQPTLPSASIPIASTSRSYIPSPNNSQVSTPQPNTNPHLLLILATYLYLSLVLSPSPSIEHPVQSLSPSPQPLPQNVHPMQTKSKSGIVQHRIHPTLLLTHLEPKSTKQALAILHGWLLCKLSMMP